MSPHKSQTKTKCRGKTVISFFPFRETHTHGSNQMETDHFSLFFFSVCPEWVDVVVVSRLVILFVGRWWWWQIGVVTSRNYIYNANTAVGTKMAVWGFFLFFNALFYWLWATTYFIVLCVFACCFSWRQDEKRNIVYDYFIALGLSRTVGQSRARYWFLKSLQRCSYFLFHRSFKLWCRRCCLLLFACCWFCWLSTHRPGPPGKEDFSAHAIFRQVELIGSG